MSQGKFQNLNIEQYCIIIILLYYIFSYTVYLLIQLMVEIGLQHAKAPMAANIGSFLIFTSFAPFKHKQDAPLPW